MFESIIYPSLTIVVLVLAESVATYYNINTKPSTIIVNMSRMVRLS